MAKNTLSTAILSQNSTFNESAASPWLLKLVLFWMVGCIISGKSFAYLSLGPIYITEGVMICLILQNFKKLTISDLWFFIFIFFYIIVGAFKYNNFFMVLKDTSILYYLSFVRFFPRNFPQKYLKIAMAAVGITLCLSSLGLVGVQLLPLAGKYEAGVSLMAFAFYVYQKRGNRFEIGSLMFFIMMALLLNFKTLIICFGILPVLGRVKPIVAWFFKPWKMTVLSFCVLAMIGFGYAKEVTKFPVHLLSSITDATIGRSYSTDTASWRVRIWESGVSNLMRDKQVLFGTFPGFNFINVKFLNLKIRDRNAIEPRDGGSLGGANRLAHNFLVQLIMKFGIVGVAFFFVFLTKFQGVASKNLLLFETSILLLAATSGLLEVPSSGPLFYSFLIALKSNENQSEIVKKRSDLPLALHPST